MRELGILRGGREGFAKTSSALETNLGGSVKNICKDQRVSANGD